jgi:hypothetical protein
MLLVGVVISPYDMAIGSLETALRIGKIVIGIFWYGKTKSKEFLLSKNIVVAEHISSQKAKNFLCEALFSVRVSMLRMVPLLGPQLANAYLIKGNLLDAIKTIFDSPSFGGLLGSLYSLPQLGYGVDNARRLPIAIGASGAKEKLRYSKEYLVKMIPSAQDAKDVIDTLCQVSNSSGIVLKVPVKTYDGMMRHHDATMWLSEKNKNNDGTYNLSNTLVYYHGNGETRDYVSRELIKVYHEKGYNVLSVSYSGDNLIAFNAQGNPVAQGTSCTEIFLREDAKADVAFVKELSRLSGKSDCHIAVHGFSFGGALAGNFVEAIADANGDSEVATVDFVILDRTFTSLPSVAANFIKYQTRSPLLANVAKGLVLKHMMEEVDRAAERGCDGLDTTKKLAKFSNTRPLKNTKFLCIGALDDVGMGAKNPGDPQKGHNFAYDLASQVPEGRGDVKMVQGGHMGASSLACAAVADFSHSSFRTNHG